MKHIPWGICLLVSLTIAQADDKPLPDQLIDVTLQYIQKNGPNSDAAQYIARSGHAAWLRRDDIVRLVAPFLKDEAPEKVAGAIEVLYRLRGYQPMSYLGDFEKDNDPFFSHLDALVSSDFAHFHSFTNGTVHHNLALFLGTWRSSESKDELLRIARTTTEQEQAVICLAWHRDPKDMEALLPYMMENSSASRILPYHFRNSYGRDALPYLQKAAMGAASETTSRRRPKN